MKAHYSTHSLRYAKSSPLTLPWYAVATFGGRARSEPMKLSRRARHRRTLPAPQTSKTVVGPQFTACAFTGHAWCTHAEARRVCVRVCGAGLAAGRGAGCAGQTLALGDGLSTTWRKDVAYVTFVGEKQSIQLDV